MEFVLVGGYAYSMHVEFRYTKDLDVWVRPTRENLECLNAASESFLGARFNVQDSTWMTYWLCWKQTVWGSGCAASSPT